LDMIRSRMKVIASSGEVFFCIEAAITRASASLGDKERTRSAIDYFIQRTGAPTLRLDYPPHAEFRAAAYTNLWRAACLIGDVGLCARTFEWGTAAISASLPYELIQLVYKYWMSALMTFENLGLAHQFLVPLSIRFTETRPLEEFDAAASMQFAEAYVDSGNSAEAIRCIDEAIRLARTARCGTWHVRAMGSGAGLLAQLGDARKAEVLLIRGLRLLSGIKAAEATVEEGLPPTHDLNQEVARSEGIGFLMAALPFLAAAPKGKQRAQRLVPKFERVATRLRVGELAIYALSHLVETTAECGLRAPVAKLVDVAVQALTHSPHYASSRSVIEALRVLHKAQMAADRMPKRSWLAAIFRAFLLEGIGENPKPAMDYLHRCLHQRIMSMSARTDEDCAALCNIIADLLELLGEMGFEYNAAEWRNYAIALANHTVSGTPRVYAATALARLHIILKQWNEVGHWLAEAIGAWYGLHERKPSRDGLNAILESWERLPAVQDRLKYIVEIQSIVAHVPRRFERDEALGRIAAGLLDDQASFAIAAENLGQAGIDRVLRAIYDRHGMPLGLVQNLLYDGLGKLWRQSRVAFAGDALFATQIAIRHRILDQKAAQSALQALEVMMRELTVTVSLVAL
jgi:tetratricopeptide (TPR) repeat protein